VDAINANRIRGGQWEAIIYTAGTNRNLFLINATVKPGALRSPILTTATMVVWLNLHFIKENALTEFTAPLSRWMLYPSQKRPIRNAG
jgi:hypothetical protein